MSIHNECMAAARQLLANPELRPDTEGPEGIFTDLDVIFLAARDAGGYGPEVMSLAWREANNVLGWLYRRRRAVRFWPVYPPGLDGPDYMRVHTKIAYAPLGGPSVVQTPNGAFPAITVDEDSSAGPGRKIGAARNDLEPWSEQSYLAPKELSREEREIVRLRAENAALRETAERLSKALTGLRQPTRA